MRTKIIFLIICDTLIRSFFGPPYGFEMLLTIFEADQDLNGC